MSLTEPASHVNSADGARHRESIHARARLGFAALTWVLAWLLLMLAPWQLQWQADRSWAQQPGLFSLVGVIGMVIFGTAEIWRLARSVQRWHGMSAWPELRVWWGSLEYAAWFMAYVFATPWLGYLLASVVFALGLTWRLGYRRRVHFGSALAVAVATVLVFKGGLSVKIAPAPWYQSLPEPLATWFMSHL